MLVTGRILTAAGERINGTKDPGGESSSQPGLRSRNADFANEKRVWSGNASNFSARRFSVSFIPTSAFGVFGFGRAARRGGEARRNGGSNAIQPLSESSRH